MPYVTGGLGSLWLEVVRAVADAGADAIEIGIPFCDPVMDGPVIQQASERALAAGITPAAIVTALGRVDVGVPLAAMTYYNVVFRPGHRRFARSLADQGVAGAIVPDLPLDELDPWGTAADDAGDRHRPARRPDDPRRPARSPSASAPAASSTASHCWA